MRTPEEVFVERARARERFRAYRERIAELEGAVRDLLDRVSVADERVEEVEKLVRHVSDDERDRARYVEPRVEVGGLRRAIVWDPASSAEVEVWTSRARPLFGESLATAPTIDLEALREVLEALEECESVCYAGCHLGSGHVPRCAIARLRAYLGDDREGSK